MTFAEIKRLVAKGESERLEFKKTTGQLPRVGATLCAFLNGAGGTVLFGVTPEGKITGQLVSDDTIRDAADVVRRIEPATTANIVRIPVGLKNLAVLAVTVEPGDESRVFTFDGKASVRVGSTTRTMGKDEADRMVVDRAQSTRRWETGTSPLNMRDLDLAEIRKTMQRAIDSGRLPSTSSSDPMDVLNGFHLRKGATLLHGAAALFAKQGSAHYPQFALRMARFRGVDKSEFLDQRQVNGNLFRLMDEAVEFLNRHLPVAGRVEPGLFERVDAPLFPPVALREALVNAFLHRDYSIVGGSVRVAVYDNRLEIWSDGSLPFGLTVGALLTNTQSRQRNPLIGEVLFRRGLVERWGRGIREIVRLCVQAGHPEPQFVEESGSFGVRFLPSAYVAPLRVGHDLTGRQREILQVLAACERASFGKIRERISTEVAERTLRDDLLHLKRLGMVESEGHGRGAKWWLVRVTGE